MVLVWLIQDVFTWGATDTTATTTTANNIEDLIAY